MGSCISNPKGIHTAHLRTFVPKAIPGMVPLKQAFNGQYVGPLGVLKSLAGSANIRVKVPRFVACISYDL